jgi:NAD(P) transhydrogenase subunit beta
MAIKWLIDASYFVAAILFILGLKGMSSPVSARKGIVWAGVGMVLATVVTFLTPGMNNFALMVIAIALGGAVAWVSGKKVAMTDMPQMVAIYNGMGGGAAAAIAAVEFARGEMHGTVVTLLATLGALIGAVSFSGSVVAWAKLQGVMKKAFRLPAQNAVNIVLALVTGGGWWRHVIAPTIDPVLVVPSSCSLWCSASSSLCPSVGPTCRW